MKLSTKGRTLLKSFEGFRADAYIPVPGDKVTIGYGFTEGVTMGQHMTKAQADARLVTELRPYEQAVLAACTMEPNQNQFDALCCLCFNIGIAGFRKSTVLKAHNRGDFQSAARAFGLWNKSSGVVYAGLTRRRAAESALYLESVLGEAGEPMEEHPMPQTVDAETPLRASPINKASVIAGTTTAVATGAQVVNTFADMGDSVERVGGNVARMWTFSELLPVVLGLMVVALCAYIVWQRWGQRIKGWT
jgi:lysozyme